ncbi:MULTISPECIES: replication initiation protein [Brucella]|uniref:replication initiation protein n=1 Tax=Brucella TaxID=234 RepID=UPI00163A76F8|nr:MULTISPECIES: replication initiation protein [Brucella]UYT55061.1 replication initiation protein [Brucella sp. MAB-22]
MTLNRQLDLFRKQTPAGMWCSNDPAQYGQRHLPRTPALERAYIDPNPRGRVWAMVFDIDRPGAALAWDDADMPTPNWVAENPANGHVHLGYVLAAPVSRSEASRGKPLRLLARIECAMTNALDADRAYSHRLTKNPGHPRWRTFWERGQPYDLDELRDYLPDNLPLRIARAEAVGEGRNVALFDGLRRWAYKNRFAYGDFDAWHAACRQYTRTLNEFAHPLPEREAMHTAKSVAKWVWVKFTPEAFAALQAARARRRAASIAAPVLYAAMAAYVENPA